MKLETSVRLPETYYDTIDEAFNHKGSLKDLKRQLDQTEKKEDTYAEQIAEMKKSAIQEIDYEKANELEDLHRHQEFLYKLLTAKDFHKNKDHRTKLDILESTTGILLGQGQTATHC